MELSAKTKAYFTTAVGRWDADFYVKVDDDVHVNIGKVIIRSKDLRNYILNVIKIVDINIQSLMNR